jgi:GDP-D-mannose dehydratase
MNVREISTSQIYPLMDHQTTSGHGALLAGPTKFHLHYGDLSDTTNLVYIIASVQPSEVYNLGAQSHVKVSFEMAEYTVRDVPPPTPRAPTRAIRASRSLEPFNS